MSEIYSNKENVREPILRELWVGQITRSLAPCFVFFCSYESYLFSFTHYIHTFVNFHFHICSSHAYRSSQLRHLFISNMHPLYVLLIFILILRQPKCHRIWINFSFGTMQLTARFLLLVRYAHTYTMLHAMKSFYKNQKWNYFFSMLRSISFGAIVYTLDERCVFITILE